MRIVLNLILAAGLVTSNATASALDIRFCPSGMARSYPLDTSHNATSLVVQGIALINASEIPARLEAVTIDLLRNGVVVDTRRLATSDLAAAAKGGAALERSGMLAAVAFQFCDGALLDKATLAASPTLEPGQAMILPHQVFAWRGARDALRVTADGSSATIPIDAGFSIPIRWPLAGGPWTVAGASFHTTHRWAVPEQFALDIVRVGADGRTHQSSGERLTDFLAYGEPVLSAAEGTVAKVIHAKAEDKPMLRNRNETMDAYLGRVGAAQMAKLSGGEAAILGESVIVDLGADVFAVYAHLKPGSAAVRAGDRVRAGQRLGALGNSGNSTEPHLHFQLCDKPSGLSCSGIPPAFSNIELPFADGPRPLQSGDIILATQ